MDDEMFIGSLVAHEGPRAAIVWMRAKARARRRPPRRNLKTPEYRALDQIVAEAEAAGNIPVVLGRSGILEIGSPTRGCGIARAVLHRRGPIDIEPRQPLSFAFNEPAFDSDVPVEQIGPVFVPKQGVVGVRLRSNPTLERQSHEHTSTP